MGQVETEKVSISGFISQVYPDLVSSPSPAAQTESAFLSSLPWYSGKPRLGMSSVEIESRLFESPLGEAFLGRHTGLGMPVIVRVLKQSMRAELKDIERFIEETRRLGQVRHPNIAGVFDMGEHLGYLYAVLEYVCGVPLIERIRQKPVSEGKALALLTPIAEGLCQMWRRGFVHRSICPHMIHLQNCGNPKLDIGLLRRNYSAPQLKAVVAKLTTPYWSPEELREQPVDPSSDMWSFGATLYHAVTGQTPFAGRNEEEMRAAILGGKLIDPRDANPELRPALREFLLKLLEPRPENRFIAMDEFLNALHALASQISGTPIPQHAIMVTELETPPQAPATPRPIDVGQVVGNCRLDKKLGAGAFGVVYRARHRVLDIDVAVKLLSVESGKHDRSFVDLFLREARTAARLRHPNIISIYEAGVQDGQHYLIMEYATGGTVAERLSLNGGRLPVGEAAHIILEAARGLTAAERLNIVHRDIKPENLMFGSDEQVKIADMGLAKRRIPVNGDDPSRSILADQLSMREKPGLLVGTPAYLAPELAVEPEKADSRADIYSLGVTFYLLLTGKMPFDGQTAIEVIMKHVLEEAPALEEIDPELPREICQLVARMLQRKPADRIQSAQEVVKALERYEAQVLV